MTIRQPAKRERLAGFGRYLTADSYVYRPEQIQAVQEAMAAPADTTLIPRGAGKSYGDAALNGRGVVLLTTRLNRFLSFDPATGVLSVEPGVTIAEIYRTLAPRGWAPIVAPGYSGITVGGCVSFDIHTKNHWRCGSFSDHVLSFTLIAPGGVIHPCSRTSNPELFWATVAGMGLTGVMIEVTLQLERLETRFFVQRSFPEKDLDAVLARLNDVTDTSEYAVSWIDMLPGRSYGRGIVFSASPAKLADLEARRIPNRVYEHARPMIPWSLTPAAPFFNRASIRVLNALFWAKNKRREQVIDLQPFLFPWDAVPRWAEVYGARGFVEYQCVIPTSQAKILSRILEYLKTKAGSNCIYFAAIKRMRESVAPLSFTVPGYSFLMDFKVQDTLWPLLEGLDRIVVDSGGRVFLAKDGRLQPAIFREMYPRWREWSEIRSKFDPEERLASDMARRLELAGR